MRVVVTRDDETKDVNIKIENSNAVDCLKALSMAVGSVIHLALKPGKKDWDGALNVMEKIVLPDIAEGFAQRLEAEDEKVPR